MKSPHIVTAASPGRGTARTPPAGEIHSQLEGLRVFIYVSLQMVPSWCLRISCRNVDSECFTFFMDFGV